MIVAKKLEAIGSIIEIKLPKNFSFLFNTCSIELQRIEETYSRFKTTSKLSIANNSLNRWVAVDEEFIYLIKKSLQYSKDTDGYFDITVKSALDKIGYDENYSFEEKKENKNIFQKLHGKLTNKLQKSILIDEKNSEILLTKQIDFGGIGKGYALDRLAWIMDNSDVDNYYINAGGDIRVKGIWEILLENPDDTTTVIGKIKINSHAIASSAPNRRKWGKDGENHHLINPKTEKPASDMKSVFVLAKTGMDADVYATGLFASGFKNAIKLSKKLPIEIMLISSDNKYYVSKGFDAELFG